MDGARLLNAVVATGVAADRYAKPVDSVWLDLSKGLGCPFGGVLAGSEDFIESAWHHKHRLGGAMRQAGIMAAAGLYALDHHVDRLAEDHANAQFFAQRLAEVKGLRIIGEPVETNLVFIDVGGTGQTAAEIANRLVQRGVRIDVESPDTLRAVTHLDISRSMVEEAADIFLKVINSF
jgi:threonine aldolase